jgi:hypothetical protein
MGWAEQWPLRLTREPQDTLLFPPPPWFQGIGQKEIIKAPQGLHVSDCVEDVLAVASPC